MRVIRSVDMHSMCMRLRTNNLATGNLLQLLDQVAARVKQTTSHMNKYFITLNTNGMCGYECVVVDLPSQQWSSAALR